MAYGSTNLTQCVSPPDLRSLSFSGSSHLAKFMSKETKKTDGTPEVANNTENHCSAPHAHSVDIGERKVTVADYKLVQEDDDQTGAKFKLKKLAKAIGVICRHIKDSVCETVTTKRLVVAGLVGGVVVAGASVAAMAALTGGLSAATVLPSAVAGGAAIPVGFVAGAGMGAAGLTLYGVAKGVWKAGRYLYRTPEERFKQSYLEAYKEHSDLMGKKFQTTATPSSDEILRKGHLEELMEERREEMIRLLRDQSAGESEWKKYGLSVYRV